MPVAFLTAMFGLQRIAGITSGTRVLVHAAAGGVGLAAVQVAQRHGAKVFATAGSAAKRELLGELGVEHVFDSRSTDFAEELLAVTDGEGVDVVLNSLSGEFIEASVRTLRSDGWFLELGKRDIWTTEQMAATRPDIHYRVYDLGDEARADHTLLGPLLDEIAAGLSDGTLHPLPVRSWDFSSAPEAFRWMAQARHVGKLVLTAPAESGDEPRDLVRSDATYWITGGAGALGLRTAEWLVDHGARHVVLTGRSDPDDDAGQAIAGLIRRGARVVFRNADAADPVAMAVVRDEIVNTMPALRGVVHAAGIGRRRLARHPDVRALVRGAAREGRRRLRPR